MTRNQNTNSSLVASGYVISILSLFILPIVFTPLGILIGIINIIRNRFIDGLIQILLAVICGGVGSYIGGVGLAFKVINFLNSGTHTAGCSKLAFFYSVLLSCCFLFFSN